MINIKKLTEKYKNMPKAAKASLWFVICGFLQRAIATITTPIFTRILSTKDYGIYSVFNSWVEIITIIITLRLCYGALVKGLVRFSDDQERFSSSSLGLTTVLISAFFVLYLPFKNFWNKVLGLNTVMMICMFVIILSVTAFEFWAVKERNAFKYKKLVSVTLFVAVLNPLCGFVAVFLSDNNKAEARIVSLAITQLVVYAFLYIKIMREGKHFYDKKYWRYSVKFNVPLVPHFLSQFILNHSDRLMINMLVGPSEAGIYSLAYSIAAILSMLNTSIENSLRPWVFQQIKAKKEKNIQSISVGALLIVAFFNLFIIAFSPEVVKIFAPKSYYEASNIMAPITMGIYFAFVYNIFVDIEMYFEKNKYVMIASTSGALVNIILNYFLIKIYGYKAAAYTTLFSYMFMAVLHYFFMKTVLRKNTNKMIIYKPKWIILVSALFMILGSIFAILAKYLIIRVCIIIILVLIAYFNKEKIMLIIDKLKRNK